MYRVLKFEFSRMLSSKLMLLSWILSVVFVLMDVWYQLDLYLNDINHISVFYKWMGVTASNFGSTYFMMAIPLLAALGYSWTSSSDRSSGYIIQILTRTSRFKYFFAKFVAVFVSGGIIFSSALILDFLLLSTFSPTFIPQPELLATFIDQFRFCSGLFYTSPYLFMLLWLLVAFLWGGSMASIALAFGVFIKKKVITIIMPFVVFTAQAVIAGYIMQKEIFFVKWLLLELCWKDMLYTSTSAATPTEWILTNVFGIIGVSLIVYGLRGRKYECL